MNAGACEVILFGGRSCSGKSTFIDQLQKKLGNDIASILNGDRYYHDLSRKDPQEIKFYNFDDPYSSLDTTLLLAHIRDLKQGRIIDAPRYSFVTHSRTGYDEFHPKPLVLLDSVLAFAIDALMREISFSVIINYPPDRCLARRIIRDISPLEQGGRGRTIESVMAQWQRDVEPMYLLHIKPRIKHATFIIPGDFGEMAIIAMAVALKELYLK